MTARVRRDEPVPAGFRITLDQSTRQLDEGLWFGGSPARVMRLTSAGSTAWTELRADGVRSRSAGQLARRLTDAGLAHPNPPPRSHPDADLTVLIPVLDRPDALARCLAALGQEHPVIVVDDGSLDPAPIAEVARRHGARLIRRDINGGPAAARNSGLAAITSEFVALIDSDCVPPAGWLAPLRAHLGDPMVAAVAPRITGIAPQTWAGRYTAARGTLDLGEQPGRVAPSTRVAYVPTAALVVRRAALLDVARAGYVFDPAMRFGEDVDLVWRLHEGGWRIRYDPSVQVEHVEPTRWLPLMRRRFRYGTSAAPLARAHPASAAPLVLHPWPALTVAALLCRWPAPAAAAFAAGVLTTMQRLRAADVPTKGTTRAMAGAVHQTWLGLGRYGTQFAAPALIAAAAVPGSRGRRLAALSLLLGGPLTAWPRRRGGLGPARFVAAHFADEVAYGAGVWAGCVAGRTAAPLHPTVAWRMFTAPSRTTTRSEPDHREGERS